MNAMPRSIPVVTLRRIAKEDVPAFLAETARSIHKAKQVQDTQLTAMVELDRHRAELLKEIEDFEKRLDEQAEELSDAALRKLKSKTQAENFAEALTQISAIMRDYQSLDGWMTDTIITAVRSVVGEVSPEDRWSGLIRKTLERTKLRWKPDLLCHPDDHDLLLAAINSGGLSDAIGQIVCDEPLPQGTCFLKAANGLFELNFEAQIDALTRHIAASLAAQSIEAMPNADV
jgi:flagellar biosynthesis/type III secretory pathway protein FliH